MIKRNEATRLIAAFAAAAIAASPASAASEISKLPAAERKIARNIEARILGKNRTPYVTPKLTRKQTLRIERAINKDRFLYGYNPFMLTYAYDGAKSSRISHRIRYSAFDRENAAMNALLGSMAKKAIKASVKSGMSNQRKVRAINEYICSRFSYHSIDQSNAYAYMKKWKGDCSSYAVLFHACMVRLKIPSRMITGKTLSGESHAWNAVKIGGRWLHVDSCWNDFSNNHAEYLLTRGVPKRHVFSYFDDKYLPSYYSEKEFLGLK